MRGLSGKTAVVTGAAGGLGRATVRRLVDEGCKVAAVDLQAADVERLAGEFAPGSVLGIAADVSRPEDCERLVGQAAGHFGGLHLLVNNAGILGRRYPLAEMPIEEFDRVHAVNVRGVFMVLRATLRAMIAQGKGGAVVNISSVGALRATRNSCHYGSAKRAVIGLSAAAAVENGQYGIRVNTVCPGPIDTPMLRPAMNNPTGDLNALFRNQPIARIADPAEVAAMIAYLLSDDASYITGDVYPVDGGMTA
jgi:3-oxoacyl-[acyl-carrier protein] reductase